MLFLVGMFFVSYTAQTLCVTALVHRVKVNLSVYPSTLLWPRQTNVNLMALTRFHCYGFV
jgi:hypothetical protein